MAPSGLAAITGLVLAGIPRVDRIRSKSGRSLDRRISFDIYVADHGQAPAGLPAILRPSASGLPLVLRTSDVPQLVAADDPRLHLHFTLPVLPSSLQREAFRIRVLHAGVLVPRSVRVVTSPMDDPDFPGSTVEIDLGSLPEHEDGTRRALVDGDFISVKMLSNSGLVDYAGPPGHRCRRRRQTRSSGVSSLGAACPCANGPPTNTATSVQTN